MELPGRPSKARKKFAEEVTIWADAGTDADDRPAFTGVKLPGSRPDPPPELEGDAADEWRALVARMPSDWFTRETWPVLVELCNAISLSRQVTRSLKDLDGWLGSHEAMRAFIALTNQKLKISISINHLSTSLRLTHQSRYAPKEAGSACKTKRSIRPWEAKVGTRDS